MTTEMFLHDLLSHQARSAALVVKCKALLSKVATQAAQVLQSAPGLEPGRLIYVGAGTSGRLAIQDAVELAPTFSFDRVAWCLAGGKAALTRSVEGAEDNQAQARRAMARLKPLASDVVIAITASGRTPYTLAALKRASAGRRPAGLTIAITNMPDSPICTGHADHLIVLPTGHEVLAGSTRLAAGTAQKIVLNVLSTQIMAHLGRVYDGLMVDVVPSNRKLVKRAIAMVSAVTGVSLEKAEQAWQEAGQQVKPAILMIEGRSLEEAHAHLVRHGGDLNKARKA
ncbi:MAG: N-acetylmuramic acid 6-phosphate etherase [Pseudomonadota bacterium]